MREIQNSLNAALKTNDHAAICSVIYTMILATDNVSAFSRKTGVNRTTLYRAFKANPGFDVVLKILSAADFKLVVVDHRKIRGKASVTSECLSKAFYSAEMILITEALSKTLRAQNNVVMFAKKAKLPREASYRSFTAPCVPSLRTVLRFLNALNLRLEVKRDE